MERIVVPVTTAAAAEAIAGLSAGPGIEVVGVAVDVGNVASLEALRAVALGAGALRCHAFDVRESLAADVLWPALRAGALGVAGEPIVAALSMPAVAQGAVEVARHEHATSIAACAEDPRERQRLHALLRSLAPSLGVVAVTCAAPSLVEHNIWAQVQVLTGEDSADAPPPAASAGPAEITVGFAHGRPVSLSGVAMTPAEIVDSLSTIARAHGLRPFVAAGDTAGTRRWHVYAPAAVALHRAFEVMLARTLDVRTAAFAATVAAEYAALVRDGLWFTALRAGLDAFVDRVLAPATGDVRMRVAHGDIEVQT